MWTLFYIKFLALDFYDLKALSPFKALLKERQTRLEISGRNSSNVSQMGEESEKLRREHSHLHISPQDAELLKTNGNFTVLACNFGQKLHVLEYFREQVNNFELTNDIVHSNYQIS